MNSNNNNNNKTQAKTTDNHNSRCNKTINPFMDITDDFFDPFNFSCDLFENKMLKSFRNLFDDLDSLSETPKEEKKEEEKPKDVEPVEEKPKEVVPEEEEKPKEVVPEEEEKPKEVVPEEEEKMDVEEEINTDSKKEEPKIEEGWPYITIVIMVSTISWPIVLFR